MLWATHMREEHLLTNKYFVCRCERCLDPTELGTNISALKCIGDIGKVCNGGTLLPKNPTDTKTDWFCDKCNVNISNEQIEILLTNIEQEVDNLLLPPTSQRGTMTVDSFEKLIMNLSHLLHENHYQMFALKHTLIQLYGHQAGYELDKLSDALLTRKISLCRDLLDILDRIDPHTIRLTLYTAVVLYELHLATLEEHRRRDDQKVSNDAIQLAQKYVQRGKDAASLNIDIEQGRKLIKSFENAEKELCQMLEKQKLGD